MRFAQSLLNYFQRYLHWILPGIIASFALAKFSIQGPFWLHQNGDVNYVYLLSGLDYLHLNDSGIYDQPGVTTKIWNALVIGIIYLFRSLFFETTSLDTDVIIHSELYLNIISLSLFSIIIFCFGVFLKHAKALVVNQLLLIVGSLTLFLSSSYFLALFLNKPEPYLILASLWLASIAIRSLSKKAKISAFEIAVCIVFGLLTKITIAPFYLVLLALPLSRSTLSKSLFFATAIMLCTALVSTDKTLYFLSWIVQLTTHTDIYGLGAEGFISKSQFIEGVRSLIRHVPMLLILVAGIFSPYKTNKKINAMLFFAYCIFLVFIIKKPSLHYFIPCYILLPFYTWTAFGNLRLDKFRIPLTAAILLLFGFRVYSYASTIKMYYLNNQAYNSPVGIQTYYSSTKSYNLFNANKIQYNRRSNYLFTIYPNDTFYHADHQFYTQQAKIPKDKLKGKLLTITGTIDYVEYDDEVAVIQKKIDGLKLSYQIRVKN